jgi:hypothetical protein
VADESYVQVGPDSTGKKIRNISLDVVQPDGTSETVLMQVTAIHDESGRPYVEGNPLPVADSELRELLVHAVELLEQIALHLGGP